MDSHYMKFSTWVLYQEEVGIVQELGNILFSVLKIFIFYISLNVEI
jgi:hypothetical protein